MEGGVTAEIFREFLYEIIHRIKEEKIAQVPVIIMDNCSIHRAKIISGLGSYFKALFTPPYLSETNPIEKVFFFLKQNLEK